VHTPDISWAKSDVFIWSTVEPSVGIISGCLPALRPLFIRCLTVAGYSPSEAGASRGRSKESGGAEESALETISKKSTRRPGDGPAGTRGADTLFLESIDEDDEDEEEGDGEMHDVELGDDGNGNGHGKGNGTANVAGGKGDAPDDLHSRYWRLDGNQFLQSTVVRAQGGAGEVGGGADDTAHSIIMTREFDFEDEYVDKPSVR
jgi:hypothetical protein